MVDVAAASRRLAVMHDHDTLAFEHVESAPDAPFTLGAFGPCPCRLRFVEQEVDHACESSPLVHTALKLPMASTFVVALGGAASERRGNRRERRRWEVDPLAGCPARVRGAYETGEFP